MDLNNFEKYSLSVGLISITISKTGITFSKTAITRLNKPRYIEILINYDDKEIAILPTDKKTEGAAPFFNPDKKNITARLNYKDLLVTLSSMMEWDLTDGSFKVIGKYDADDNALIFDLKTAVTS